MSYEQFIVKRFNKSSQVVIAQADVIIREYAEQGFSLTLRQLYYQFVARDLLPNKQKNYKRLGSIVSDARLAGLLPWNAIEDRTRSLRGNTHWTSPKQILRSAAAGFYVDKWVGQRYRPEVWIEKDALVGVIEGVCTELDVDYFACRGYTSQSEQWRAGRRFKRRSEAEQIPVVIHLGDHDPSGIDMTRDNRDRLALLSRHTDMEVRRIALNMDQVQAQNPPPNPAKATDSRYEEYRDEYGEDCWELDALEPSFIEKIVREEVLSLRDDGPYEERCRIEQEGKDQLEDFISQLDNPED